MNSCLDFQHLAEKCPYLQEQSIELAPEGEVTVLVDAAYSQEDCRKVHGRTILCYFLCGFWHLRDAFPNNTYPLLQHRSIASLHYLNGGGIRSGMVVSALSSFKGRGCPYEADPEGALRRARMWEEDREAGTQRVLYNSADARSFAAD